MFMKTWQRRSFLIFLRTPPSEPQNVTKNMQLERKVYPYQEKLILVYPDAMEKREKKDWPW